MHYFEFANRDTTLYSGGVTASINTGMDEILEVKKEVSNDGSIVNTSRILIDFDYTYISSSLQTGRIGSDAKFYLNLYDATSSELEVEQKLFVYMVSGSWLEGTGKLFDNPVTEKGSSFKYRDTQQEIPWVTGSRDNDGGSWYTGSLSGQYEVSSSHNLTYESKDLRINVTDMVNNHIYSSSVYPNNGFIVKRQATGSEGTGYYYAGDAGSDEGGSGSLGTLKFFSRQTHTIYPPKLEVVWDDSSWSTGSLNALSSTDLERLKVYFKNIRPEYNEKSVTKFRVVGRELYPSTTFDTTPATLTIKYLPSASAYYSVRDFETEEEIIPFGTGSKISCDSTGNYFNLNMNGLQAERKYRFLIKVVSGSGTLDEQVNYYDEDDYVFKVVR